MTIINLIQDLATPHNNVLIKEFQKVDEATIKLWYAYEEDANRYAGAKNITAEHIQPEMIYGRTLNWRFIKYCLLHAEEKYLIVGWMNTNTRLLLFLFFVFRRKFNYWSDTPDIRKGDTYYKKIFRWFSYKMLKYSKVKIFAVGITTVNYFRKLGFAKGRIVNLPVFVDLNDDVSNHPENRNQIYEKYGFATNNFIISAGSRVIYEKGFDLLIKAIYLLDAHIKKSVRVIIVGSGDALESLKQLTHEAELSQHITFEKWLPIGDFKEIIANSDVFIQPARKDAYGGTLLGMAMGVPVIGSYQSGAAVDRIKHHVNGFLYEAENTEVLASYIKVLFLNPELCKLMGNQAYQTALEWPPMRGVRILIEHSI